MLFKAARRLSSPSLLHHYSSYFKFHPRPFPAMATTMNSFSTLASLSNGTMNAGDKPPVTHTLTALKRWSCDDRPLPSVSDVKAIHVYDFDNTLFASPLPNKQLWNSNTIGAFMAPNFFVNGGWWHDSSILASTGEGVEKEEPRAWNGWWNEHIVTLVQTSMQQKDALTVLITGRSENKFSELIKRIVKAKKLDFHMICLKPSTGPAGQKFTSTMSFKQTLLKEMVFTYSEAEDIRIYEDRPTHTKGFRDFFFQFNTDLMSPSPPFPRKPITCEVIQVTENATQLDPVAEVAEIQRLINAHNTMVKEGTAPHGTVPYEIRKTVFYTGYMIARESTEKLVTLVQNPGNNSNDIRYLANSILITPKPATRSILDRVGGLGKKVNWKVTGISCLENKLWAARVEPVSRSQRVYTENSVPTVVLAVRRGARPADVSRIVNWHPVPESQAFVFESTVGEKVILRVEEETGPGAYRHYNNGRRNPRERDDVVREDVEQVSNDTAQHIRDLRPQHRDHRDERENRRPNGPHGYRGGHRERGRGQHRSAFAARGRGDRFKGGRGRGRGGAGQSQYRSRDDVEERVYGGPIGGAGGDDAHSYY